MPDLERDCDHPSWEVPLHIELELPESEWTVVCTSCGHEFPHPEPMA